VTRFGKYGIGYLTTKTIRTTPITIPLTYESELLMARKTKAPEPPPETEQEVARTEALAYESDALAAARELVNLSELTPFVRVLCERKHTSERTALAAMASAMIAAYRVVLGAQGGLWLEHKSQAYRLMWLMVEEIGCWEGRSSPKGIVDYARLLDPANDHEFSHEIPREAADYLSGMAKHRLVTKFSVGREEARRLGDIANGVFPKFIRVIG